MPVTHDKDFIPSHMKKGQATITFGGKQPKAPTEQEIQQACADLYEEAFLEMMANDKKAQSKSKPSTTPTPLTDMEHQLRLSEICEAGITRALQNNDKKKDKKNS